jgi:phytoene/squalene synthetase
MTTTAEDPITAYIRNLHQQFEQERDAIRTRTIALGYAFGRAAERVADGGDPPDEDATAFADFYQAHSDGSWADLTTQYTAFLTRKDTP